MFRWDFFDAAFSGTSEGFNAVTGGADIGRARLPLSRTSAPVGTPITVVGQGTMRVDGAAGGPVTIADFVPA